MLGYRLIALDVDGTLTNSEKKMTKKTREALIRAEQQGALLAIASGRPLYGLVPLMKELEMDRFGGYLLAFNGGQVVDALDLRVMDENSIPLDILYPLLDWFSDYQRRYDVAMLTYGENGTVLTERGEAPYVLLESRINAMPVEEVSSMRETIVKPVPKVLLSGPGEILEKLEQETLQKFGDSLSIFRSEAFFLEVCPQGIDKGNALARLLSLLHMKREELMAFGDGYNDLSMMEYAGLGIAMGNAKEEIKNKADDVTLSNDEDGIAAALNRWLGV